jgi:hypothetical protein
MSKGAKEKGGGLQSACSVMLEFEPWECIFSAQLLFITQDNNSYKSGNVMYV